MKNQQEPKYDYLDNQYNLKELLAMLKEKDELTPLLDDIGSIKKEYLYKSETHGIKHNQRVEFFAYVICLLEGVKGNDRKIILDACKYHDVGRTNDDEDKDHGFRSTLQVGEILSDDSFYNKKRNLNYLKAIIEIHSIDDEEEQHIYKDYHLKDIDRFRRLYQVLKDADVLDRVRLSYEYPEIKWLDVNMLRTSTAKKLVKCAYQLNDETL